jgi:hypothetical protein
MFLNLNQIGAYVFSLVLIAIVLKRPSFHKIELQLWRLPFLLHIIIISLISGLVLNQAFDWSFLRIFDLPTTLLDACVTWVHEAGHFYWSWAPELLHSLGGTLNEIIFTFGLGLFFYWRGYVLQAMLAGMMTAFVLPGIAAYAGDARARKLELLGGDSYGHDWESIFSTLGLLQYDTLVSAIIFHLTMPLLIICGSIYLIKTWQFYR